MENYQVTNLQVTIKTEELVKCEDHTALKKYIGDIVVPLIHTSLTSLPKGWEVGGSCSSDRGCEVRGSISGK